MVSIGLTALDVALLLSNAPLGPGVPSQSDTHDNQDLGVFAATPPSPQRIFAASGIAQ